MVETETLGSEQQGEFCGFIQKLKLNHDRLCMYIFPDVIRVVWILVGRVRITSEGAEKSFCRTDCVSVLKLCCLLLLHHQFSVCFKLQVDFCYQMQWFDWQISLFSFWKLKNIGVRKTFSTHKIFKLILFISLVCKALKRKITDDIHWEKYLGLDIIHFWETKSS